MTKTYSLKVLGLTLAASMLLAACGGAAPAPTAAPAPAATDTPAAAAPAATDTPAAPAATDTPAAATTAVTSTTAMTATKPTAAPSTAGGGKTVTIGFYQEPSATYANYSTQTFAAWLGNLTTLGVWYFDEKGAPVLELAAEFPSADKGTISKDGKTITYKLKKDLKWSDGEPITSADFKYTFEQIMSDANKGTASKNGYDQIAKIDTPDAQTAVVTFKDVFSPWPTLFLASQGGLLPQHALKDLKTLDNSDFVTKGTGPFSGPFTIKEVVKGDHLTLAANPNYWRGKPKLDTVNIKIVESRDAVLAGLRAGDLDIGPDFVEGSIPDLDGLKDTVDYFATPGSSFEHYFFNLGTGDAISGPVGPCPFKDPNVRKAFILGIDRQTIADKLLYGKTRVIATLWPVAPWEDTNLKPLPFDAEQAKKLLDDAGYKPGSDGIRVGKCDGKDVKLSFKHATTAGNTLRANVQTLVQENLKNIGIEFTPDNVQSSVLFASYTDGGTFTTGKYELGGYTTGFVAGGDPSPSDAFKISGIPTEKNPAGGNNYHLVDKDLDQLSADQEKASDPAARKAIIDKMQQIIYDKSYVIPMYARLSITAHSKKVTGMKMVADNIFDVFTNSWEWDVSQ